LNHQLLTLTQINLDDLVSSFGWEDRPNLARLLHILFRRPAHTFAGQMLAFDQMVGSHNLMEASIFLIKNYAKGVKVFGTDNVPPGPVLVLANHPGMVDTLALFAALKRQDLRIIAVHRPFLNALPNITQRLDYVTEDPGTRISLVRRVSSHLKSGGAVLTFPSGKIEPDPDVYPGAETALHSWTDSVGVFLRLAPETAVLPVLVRGVIWEKTASLPVLRIKNDQLEREKLAAALQLLAHVVFQKRPLEVSVQIGNPLTVQSIGGRDTNTIHSAVITEMQRLLAQQPEGQFADLI